MSIHVDPKFGHITAYDNESGRILATAVDMGPTLAVEALIPDLTPDQAYEYAHAIFKWAATKRRAARARAAEIA